jgi:hypothetical protein
MSKAPTAHPKQSKVNDSELVDIDTVKIDIDLPIAERVQQCINQVKNPYRFRAGGVIVNIEHLNNGLTLESAFSSYLNDLM